MELDDNFDLANERARELQASLPRAMSAHYDRRSGRIVIHLNSKLDVTFSPRDAEGLESATPAQSRSYRDLSLGLRHPLPRAGCRSLPAFALTGIAWLREMDGQQTWLKRRQFQERGEDLRRKEEWAVGR